MLERHFGDRGHKCFATAETTGLTRLIDEVAPDLVLLDWMLPGMPGIEVLRTLRSEPRYAALPVIMLTARTTELDRVEGLLSGADDYVSKPFSLAELEARISSVLRRSQGSEFGYLDARLSINPAQKRLAVDGRAVSLTLHEWTVLECLLSTYDPVARRDIVIALWGPDAGVSDRSIDNIVMRLRRALGDDLETGEPYIVTERGQGYRFARRRPVRS